MTIHQKWEKFVSLLSQGIYLLVVIYNRLVNASNL
ncbi:hypothetical protein M083_1126, partial [Bacteroides fragilis str. 3986 T(B)9]